MRASAENNVQLISFKKLKLCFSNYPLILNKKCYKIRKYYYDESKNYIGKGKSHCNYKKNWIEMSKQHFYIGINSCGGSKNRFDCSKNRFDYDK